MKNKVVHFEIPVDDAHRATKFYSIFDWKMDSMPDMSYTMISTVEVGEDYKPKEAGAINGGMMKRLPEVQSPVFTIQVDSIEEIVTKIEEAGGKMVLPRHEVHGMGFSAYFKDSEGNVVGLWEPVKK